MFGYLTVDAKKLSKEDVTRYRRVYCGICRALGESYAIAGRAALTYDMVFLALLLLSLSEMEETERVKRCVAHPLSEGRYIVSPVIEYAADMNIILAYYQALDGWKDDRRVFSLWKHKSLAKAFDKAKARRPSPHRVIDGCLKQLGQMEAANELNPDLPANTFGALLGEVFAFADNEWNRPLRLMGEAMGRFIYLLDAVNDLRADIRRERYNPLTAQIGMDFLPMLQMLLSECTAVFETLPVKRDLAILYNVLYSGVWTRYTGANT